MSSHSRRRRGFTLMELMVVIAILGILLTLVAQNFIPFLARGNETAAKAEIKALYSAAMNYKMLHKKLPDSIDILTQPDPQNFDQAWIEEEAPILDPWDNPYVLEIESGMKFGIISYGADGAPGGEGEDRDIDSRTMNQKTEE